MKKTYSEKLKDPRWQKKRLEVFNRDGFTCKSCESTKKTLHVHHLNYIAGREPWDYDLEYFITLCEDCHAEVSELRPLYEKRVIAAFRMKVPDVFNQQCGASVFDSVSRLDYLLYLLWELSGDENRLIEILENECREVQKKHNDRLLAYKNSSDDELF